MEAPAPSREGDPSTPAMGTHVHHQEAGGQHVAPCQDEAAQQVFAPAVEVGELPAQEGQPGVEGEGCWVLTALPARGKGLQRRAQELACHPPLGPRGQRLVPRGRGEVGGHKVPQGQELAFGIQQHLSIWGGTAWEHWGRAPHCSRSPCGPLLSPWCGMSPHTDQVGERGSPHPGPSRTGWPP